jgi:trans-aconitate methyltransferase
MHGAICDYRGDGGECGGVATWLLTAGGACLAACGQHREALEDLLGELGQGGALAELLPAWRDEIDIEEDDEERAPALHLVR